jgi:hypothetical protein
MAEESTLAGPCEETSLQHMHEKMQHLKGVEEFLLCCTLTLALTQTKRLLWLYRRIGCERRTHIRQGCGKKPWLRSLGIC